MITANLFVQTKREGERERILQRKIGKWSANVDNFIHWKRHGAESFILQTCFRTEKAQVFWVLGPYVCVNCFPTFRRNVLPSSSVLGSDSNLWGLRRYVSSNLPEEYAQQTPRKNPEDLLPQQSRDGNIYQCFVLLRIYLFLIVYLP